MFQACAECLVYETFLLRARGYETLLFRARGYKLFLSSSTSRTRVRCCLCPLSSGGAGVRPFAFAPESTWLLGTRPKGTRPADLAYLWGGFQAKGYKTFCANSKRYTTFCRLHVWRMAPQALWCCPQLKTHLFRTALGRHVLGDCC